MVDKEEFEVGKVYNVKKDNGKTVPRKCIGIIDPQYLEEQGELIAKNGFAPMFIKDGKIFLSMSPNDRRLSEEEKAKRAKAAANKKEARRQQLLGSAMKKKELYDKRVAELQK